MRKVRRIIFTKEGYEKIKNEYEELQGERKNAVLTLKQARELGDLSENGLYKAARARLSSIDYNLRRLSYMIKVGIIAEKAADGVVGIGSNVTVHDGTKTRDFLLVGDYEADPKNGKISTISPIGRVLVGRRLGEKITVEIPTGIISYTILQIGTP